MRQVWVSIGKHSLNKALRYFATENTRSMHCNFHGVDSVLQR
jgi:hypothetical protein